MYAVIDFEGFQLRPFKFVVKELAFCGVLDFKYGHWTFQPPTPWENLDDKQKRAFGWVTRNVHGMSWESGHLPYEKLENILKYLASAYTCLYVKGYEKKSFLENLLDRDVYCLPTCPKLEHLPRRAQICSAHLDYKHCALVKATAYADHLKTAYFGIMSLVETDDDSDEDFGLW